MEPIERYLRAFVAAWRRPRDCDLTLSVTGDPNYASLPYLLTHVLHNALGYIRS